MAGEPHNDPEHAVVIVAATLLAAVGTVALGLLIRLL